MDLLVCGFRVYYALFHLLLNALEILTMDLSGISHLFDDMDSKTTFLVLQVLFMKNSKHFTFFY